ncbi:reverse transcriptase domain-containing protein [Tanacetum coccineum]
MALESGKLNHLVKDIRQRGRGSHGGDAPQPPKIINVISMNSIKDKKQKGQEVTEAWMNTSITFPSISLKDISDEPLIVEAEVEGYLVRLVYVDEGSLVEVMFKHCFKNLDSRIKVKLKETQTNLVGFAWEISKPLGKIELAVCFGNGDNMGIFAWEPSDMTGVPQQIIEHTLKKAKCQKRITFSPEKSGVITNEVAEWVKAGIVRLVRYKCFLDAYKGYHHIQMAKEDEEKKPFYTDQETYCYTKILFELKNAEATYQRLVDSIFQTQIGRNLEAYVDGMVIKSKDEKILLSDIAETFDNLKKINMKLNPKKCSFGVEEGKFLGYMSLSGKLAALNQFLAKSAERSLPFFNTLKNITKKNKHEYQWTSEVEEAFQQMKKLILDLPSLTSPFPKETLYAYLTIAAEAVSAVLLTDRKGRQCPIQYVSRTLNKAERNYTPMEKLALSLIHMTRRLRRYFEAHPVKVITDQSIKHILSQVLADFLSEALEGEMAESYFRMPEVPLERDNFKSWTLFTGGASNLKGSRAGLVLIGPSSVEYTYDLHLTFLSTNNEAEYEALLVGLRIARKMNISNIEVRVDSKLVASQINKSYEASKDGMIKYLAKAKEYISSFKSFSIENIPRNLNLKANKKAYSRRTETRHDVYEPISVNTPWSPVYFSRKAT